ncbi:hypothetical protein OTU49_001206, partial [Cherax quadricarinatus]
PTTGVSPPRITARKRISPPRDEPTTRVSPARITVRKRISPPRDEPTTRVSSARINVRRRISPPRDEPVTRVSPSSNWNNKISTKRTLDISDTRENQLPAKRKVKLSRNNIRITFDN